MDPYNFFIICKMSSRTTYHRENRDIILIEQNNIMKKTEKYLESKQEINIENYLKKKKI